ncbi:MAG: acyl-CoA dehydratase activase-related protein [Acidobacteriia bacterium]|nr:acyl-CoA dehydratase activase-related protein [Terriglobia bacterium]
MRANCSSGRVADVIDCTARNDDLCCPAPEDSDAHAVSASPERFVGVDIGAETIKAVELVREDGLLRTVRRVIEEHAKDPGPALLRIFRDWDWSQVQGAAVCGRLSRHVNLPRVPTKQAMTYGYRFLFGDQPGTIVSLGNHGFCVLELRASGMQVLRENSRCAQGTGNFLRQLVERFALSIEEASELCADVDNPAPLSGRCPVILKTDMTHLANKGEERARILAGLFDAVCQNVFTLIKPGIAPPDVALIGGVSRSRRVQRVFAEFLDKNGMTLRPLSLDDALFLEAIGAAVAASTAGRGVADLDQLLAAPAGAHLEKLPALSESLHMVRRREPFPMALRNGKPLDLILGFDIGSTGSKLVALDVASSETAWEGYQRTSGDPVGAAQALLGRFLDEHGNEDRIVGLGVTGSGREIVGSLLLSCYGESCVFILNEIAAHAQGAMHYDARVDTIFEIGGQDAKYIRLEEGRIIDSAMNEACSAGTGSFIEEQGQRFAGYRDVIQLGQEAVAAGHGVSLGQHCSVFMAEIIDEAVAAGVDQKSIIAGLYDSIVQNYLHRVKGNRSIGKVIFCQGMPFSSDALAAAVARQTGSEVIVPPNPGTVGALGIALLAQRALRWRENAPSQPTRFLEACIEEKETFVCKSTRGCGGAGNLCKIDAIRTVVAGKQQRFSWGGACSLYDKATRKKKLPDLSPDPFREREDLARELIRRFLERRGFRTVAITDEFILKGLLPFFVAFLYELGLDPLLTTEADQATLKRGIREANIPFCAPMQLYHGIAGRMSEESGDFVFLPMLRGIPRDNGERDAVTCPIVQGSSDILLWNLKYKCAGKILTPVIDVGHNNLRSAEFLESCERLAGELGAGDHAWPRAHEAALAVQQQFDEGCMEIGARALRFCSERRLPAIVVLGRPYTIYNTVLNSNVPAVLREQGMLAIPLDCYPVSKDVPTFDGMYWGFGQRILRAAHQVRRSPGIYAVYCSNYSCGPDSFNLHFCSYIMEGKPFAVIETDGHSGDAGTKTRIEAFLYCVAEDLKHRGGEKPANDFLQLQLKPMGLMEVRPDETLLVAGLGAGSAVAAAAFRGLGLRAELLPEPGAGMLKLGRRYTSGKECVPMCLILGSLLGRLEREKNTRNRFVILMPGARGPCRFGVYNLLNQVTLERLGWQDRIRIYAPEDSDYFERTPPGFPGLFLSAIVASDLLLAALHETRPAEIRPGAAAAVYERYMRELEALVERETAKGPSMADVIWQVTSGRLFGVARLMRSATAEFARNRGNADLPVVAVVGEIYVRLNPFANDSIIEKLEKNGIRARLAPLGEWLEYADYMGKLTRSRQGWSEQLRSALQRRIMAVAAGIFADRMGGHFHTPVPESLAAAGPYIRKDLLGEAAITLGYALSEWRKNRVDGIVNLGPLECMPTKIAEAQFFHVAEQDKALVLTLPVNGDPLDPQLIENFSFEVRSRHQRRRAEVRDHQ